MKSLLNIKHILFTFYFLFFILVIFTYSAQLSGVVNVPARIEIYQDNRMIKRTITEIDGTFSINIKGGRYKLIFSRGPEYKPVIQIIDIKKEEKKKLTIILERVFNMNEKGWFSGDAHMHTVFSDGRQQFKELVAGAHSEGLNFIVSTEHNEGCIKAYRHLQKNNYDTKDFIVILGEEITTDVLGKNFGHFNALGIKEFIPYNLNTPRETFDAAHKHDTLIIVNHPFDVKCASGVCIGSNSYFWLVENNYVEFAENFDGIEVWNNTYNTNDEETLRYYFKLLNEGYKYFIMANSDSHDIYSSPLGTPRTYVYLGEKELKRENILSALKQCKAFLTDGPLIYKFEINNKSIGEEVEVEKDKMINITFDIKSLYELKEVSIIRNGSIFYRENRLKGNECKRELNINLKKDSWFILRVTTKDGKQALTNPIWVKVK